MNEEALKYAHSLFQKDGYQGDINKFRSLMSSNPEAVDYAHTLFRKDGFTSGIDKFKTLVGFNEPVTEQQVPKEQPWYADKTAASSARTVQSDIITTPKPIADDIKSHQGLYDYDLKTKGIADAKKSDFDRKLRSYEQAVNYYGNIAATKFKDYAKQRASELNALVKTKEQEDIANRTLQLELETYRNKLSQEAEYAIKDKKNLVDSAMNDRVLQETLRMSPEEKAAYSKNYSPEIPATEIPGIPGSSLALGVISAGTRFLKSGQAALSDLIPSGYYESSAASLNSTFDDKLFWDYVSKNKAIDITKLSSKQIDDYKKAAVDDYKRTEGEDKYSIESNKYAGEIANKRVALSQKADVQRAEMAGKMAGAPASWQEAQGIKGVADYIANATGQVMGLAVPTIAAGMIPGVGEIVAPMVGMTVMGMIEKGEAFNEGVDLLKEKYPNLDLKQIYQKNLDADLRDETTKAAIINGALEYVGQLSALGKLVPKNQIFGLFNKLTKKAGAVPVLGTAGKLTIGALGEGLTEWLQRKETRISTLMGTDPNLSYIEAAKLAFEQDDTEDFIGGVAGGAGMAGISTLLSAREKNKNEIESLINNVATTGNTAIDNQIDSEAEQAITITQNDQEKQAGVPSTQPQGQAAVQEGAQPQVSGTQTETGGVLQVSPEAPGAGQAEVAPTVTEPQVKPTEQPEAQPQSKYQKGQETFIVRDNRIIPVTVQGYSPSGKSVSVQMKDGSRELVDPNNLFDNEQKAMNFLENPKSEPVVKPEEGMVESGEKIVEATKPEEGITIEEQSQLEELFGKPEAAAKPTNIAYTDDGLGNIVQVSVVDTTDQTATVQMPDGSTATVVKPQLFQTEQEAKNYFTKQATTKPVAEAAQAEQPKVTAPTLTRAESNNIKRYFFNKFPDLFGDMGVALSMSPENWASMGRRLYAKATPEEKAMLEKLVGLEELQKKQEEVKPEVKKEEGKKKVTPLVDDERLLENGYTQAQIDKIYENPDKYGQIDDKIVDLESGTLVKALGKKKAKPKPAKPVVKKYPKKTYEDLITALNTDNLEGGIKTILEIVAGMNNKYSKIAIKLIDSLLLNENAKDITYRTEPLRGEENLGGVYRGNENEIAVFHDKIKQSIIAQNDKKKIGSGKLNDKDLKNKIQDETLHTIIHEVVHGLTAIEFYSAIPGLNISKGPQPKLLSAYLKNGSNPNIKNVIKLYLSAKDQANGIVKTGKENRGDKFNNILQDLWIKPVIKKYAFVKDQADIYGFTNVLEFMTESFSNVKFQALLNELDSPISVNKSSMQEFIDAIRRLFGIDVREGSILEAVIRITPEVMISNEELEAYKRRYNKVKLKSILPGLDPKTSALTKIAQRLVDSGKYNKTNVISKLKELVGSQFNINIDDYADDILSNITEKQTEAPVTPMSTADLIAEFNQDINRSSLGIGEESKAFAKAAKVEKIADFLRGKVSTLEEVTDFIDAWNQSLTPMPDTGKVNPDAYVSSKLAGEIFKRISGTTKTVKGEKVATAAEVIEAQWNARAKGMTQGVKETTKTFKENLIKAVQESMAANNLTPNQINQMLAAVKRVNLFTAGSISRLKERIRQIEENAALADKIKYTRDLKKNLAKLAKSPKIMQNYPKIAKALSKVDTAYLTEYNGVDALDAYIEHAEAVIAGFQKIFKTVATEEEVVVVSTDKYNPILISKVQDYINAQHDYAAVQEAIELFDLSKEDAALYAIEGMSLEELESYLKAEKENKLVEAYKELIDELRPQLESVNDPNNTLATLKTADLSSLKSETLALIAKAMDNLITNEDFSMVDMISNKIKADNQMVTAKQTLLGKAIGNLSKLALAQQITQMIDTIYKNKILSSTFYNLSGIYDYLAGTAKAEKRRNEMGKALGEKMDQIDNKYKGKKLVRNEREIVKLSILSEFAKYVADTTEHIETIHDNMQKSIDLWMKHDEEKGKLAKEIYNRYANIKSADQIISIFKQEDPHVYELWEYITNTVFNSTLQNEIEYNTTSVHNKSFVPFVNYMPTVLRNLGIEAEAATKEGTDRKSTKPAQAKTTLEAKRKVNANQAYNFFTYLDGVLLAYQDTIHDIETSKHLQLFNYFANNPDFESLVGNAKNRKDLIRRMIDTDRIEKRIGSEMSESLAILNSVSNWAAEFGAVTALGGLDQAPLQYASAMTSAMIMLGRDVDLFFAAPMDLKPNTQSAVDKLIAKTDVSVRGSLHRLDLAAKPQLVKYKNQLSNIANKLGKGGRFLSRDVIMKALTWSDKSVAQRAFVAFYLQSLRQQGIKGVDLSVEFKKTEDPTRKQALAYASMMISDLQVASTTAGRSKLMAEPGNVAIIRKLLLPFSSFPINTKMRIVSAIDKMTTAESKAEGVRELAAVIAEAATFNGIKIFLLPFYYAAIKGGIESIYDFEPPEEEEEDPEKKRKKFLTMMLLEANPLNVGLLSSLNADIINYINWGLTESEARTINEFIKEDNEPVLEKMYDMSKYNDFFGYGQYGIGMKRFADGIDAAKNAMSSDYIVIEDIYGEHIIERDSEEIDDLAKLNVYIQYLPMWREVRTQAGKVYKEQMKQQIKRQSNEGGN